MRTLARRHRELTEEIKVLDAQLALLVGETAPDMLARHGVGPQSAAQLLITAGDNPDRLDEEGSFAHLCGVAPLPARPRASARTDTASTPAETATPTTPCT